MGKTFTSLDIMERGKPLGLTFRKLDYWCHRGIFGSHNAAPGSGSRRQFSEEDLDVALVLAKVSCSIDTWTEGRGGFVPLYADLAAAIRSRQPIAVIPLSEGIDLHIDLAAMDGSG